MWAQEDGARFRCHNPVWGARTPSRMHSLLSCTVKVEAVKVTTHPASQSCPMERGEDDCKSGTICTRRAAKGRLGVSSSAS